MKNPKPASTKKREDILAAAVLAFQTAGYESASMDRIAELAKASKRTVYNYFESKEILFQEVVNSLHSQLSSLKQIPFDPERKLAEQLDDFAEAKMALVKNPSWLGLSKVVFTEFIRNPELAQNTIGRVQAGDDALILWLKAANAAKVLSVPDAELAARFFWAMISGAFVWPMIIEGPAALRNLEELKGEIIQTFLQRYAS